MTIRDLLRGLPVFDRPLPTFDTDSAPEHPLELFHEWFRSALDAEADEPHVMTLCTVDADGQPDARSLILKDLNEVGWQFATGSRSAKGRQIAGNSQVALLFYWRGQGRQVRVRGAARAAAPETSRQDFLDRPEGSRIATLAGRQSDVLPDPSALDRELAAVRARMAADPELVAETHTVYTVVPDSVEFWQGDQERKHIRLRYLRDGTGWRRELLWP